MIKFWFIISLIILFIIIITFLFVRSVLKGDNKNDNYDIPDIDLFI
jgi:cbb3-type cytochrome oxidase subunit 3